MATKFADPGGDATFLAAATNAGGFYNAVSATVVSDIVHGSHLRSYKPTINSATGSLNTFSTVLADAGTRLSFYLYINVLPSGTTTIWRAQTSGGALVIQLKVTSAGVLQLFEASSQIGSNGSTLATGTWYRISVADTLTSTTVNEIRVFKNGTIDISTSNQTLTRVGSASSVYGYDRKDGAFDTRYSDLYVDDSSALIDTGDIWVTAKRPNANGTTNAFTTQIGSGGSGYGSGHAPQVNERPLSVTNGWSIAAVGVTVEEYNGEAQSVGDIDLTNATIIDVVGWVYASALVGETAQIILNGATFNITLSSSAVMFTAVAGSSTYPAGTGTDIGLQTSSTATTVSLFECGMIVAYIPAVAAVVKPLAALGVG